MEEEISQLFGKVLYAIKNPKRRLILEAFNESETLTIEDLKRYSIEKGLWKKVRPSNIRNLFLKPWIDAQALDEPKKSSYKITVLGKNINRAISGAKKLDKLELPTRQNFYGERILLELRDGNKGYQELTLKLNLSDPKRDIKKLKDRGLVKVIHPKNLLRVPRLTKFQLSSYYYFIGGFRDWQRKYHRSWFTAFSVITALNQKWLEIFGRPMDFDESSELLEKGIKAGDIIKNNGSYSLAPIKNLGSTELKIFESVKNGCSDCSTISAKTGYDFTWTYKILKKLEKMMLVEKQVEGVIIELTEKGKRLADCLFKIKKCLIDYLKRIELEEKAEIY